MYTSLRYATLTVRLADDRVLIHRQNHGGWPQWSVTHESFLSHHELPLVEANRILMTELNLNPMEYDDKVADIRQLGMISLDSNRTIHPFLVKMHSTLEFKCKAHHEYRPMLWDDIIDDIIKEAVRSNMAQKYTYTAKLLVKSLNKSGAME